MAPAATTTPLSLLTATKASLEALKAASPNTPIIDTTEKMQAYLAENDIKLLLFDCDGVIYRSTTPTSPRLTSTLAALQSDPALKLAFVTNSSGKSREQCHDKMKDVTGIDTFTSQQFFPAGYSAAKYLKNNHPSIKKAYVIGGVGLVDSLEAEGISCVGGPIVDGKGGAYGAAGDYQYWVDDKGIEQLQCDEGVQAVVIGMAKDFNYRMLTEATMYLTHKSSSFDGSKTLFLSTNLDPFDVIGGENRRQPAAGCMVKAVEFATDRESITVGKPSKALWDVIRSELEMEELPPSKVLMIGDRRDTDIRFGNVCGMRTGVVLSGCTTSDDILEMEKQTIDRADVIIPHVGIMK